MSFRRAIWVEDQSVFSCTKCRAEFNYVNTKHHCRKCGLVFCHDCTKNKCLIPQDELVPRPTTWMSMTSVISNEDNFRCPQRVCDACCYQLRDIQEELRQSVSRAHQDTIVSETSKLPNMPGIDFYLEKEIGKATTMLYNFKNGLGEEKIPRELLDIAKGVVFFTIIKVGFMFTGRYGTGLVVAKLADGTWSAPSAVQMTGVGWGLQVGAELTDVMLILSSDSAVNAFKSRAQVSVGAELGVSVGPIGRSIESDVTAGNKGAAHAFSYAQSKGLFVGASLEASGIAARPDVNRTFYGQKVSISALLQGDYPRPRGAQVLYDALNDVLYNGGSPTPPRPPRGLTSMVESSHTGEDPDSSQMSSNNSSTSSTGSGKQASSTAGPPSHSSSQQSRTHSLSVSAGSTPPQVQIHAAPPRGPPAAVKGTPPRTVASAQGTNIYVAQPLPQAQAVPVAGAPVDGESVDVQL